MPKVITNHSLVQNLWIFAAVGGMKLRKGKIKAYISDTFHDRSIWLWNRPPKEVEKAPSLGTF